MNKLMENLMVLATTTQEQKRQKPLTADQVLFSKILVDALETIDRAHKPKASARAKQDAREAEEWLLAEDHDYVLSAVNCCEQLNLSHSAIVDGYRKGTLQIMVYQQRAMADAQ